MKKADIIAIDPGTSITGYALLKINNTPELITAGVITPKNNKNPYLNIKYIVNEIAKLIRKYKPYEGIIEKVYFFKNKKTAMRIAELRGAIIYLFINKNLEVYEYTPLEVKQALTGYGRAGKREIQKIEKYIFNLDKEIEPDDAADAVALGICHINNKKFMQLIKS